ncbi:MAG: LysM peptidoglycan-binding domain-containing protein [Gemmatimonadetes bacterium]|nr:LysM peptidoglycan-binding domain-containing protein [Gemmatimonadota bacterium]
MPLKTSPLAPSILVLGLLTLGACAPSARGVPSGPTPVVVETESLGDGPEIEEEEVVVVERDLLGGVAYDLPVEANSWVEAELEYLVGQRSAVIGRWLERGDFYEDFVKGVLTTNGLPTDLYHLAMIESGFIPTARSRAGAMGMWQFMPATGRMEGLRVDNVVDERMDPVRSTYAAAQHLRMLHRHLRGDWALAAAAYNAGAGRITRGMQGYGATNFWDLAVMGDLADETKHYVPRLYAVTIIARDRNRFGFAERRAGADSFAYDSVHVDLATPLSVVAEVGGLATDDLVRLNPHLLQRTTPAGSYWVWVPVGTGASVQQAYMQSDFRRGQGYGSYTVRRGDNLGKLAEASGVSASHMREMNPKTNWEKLAVGHRLRLPATAVRTLQERPVQRDEVKIAATEKKGSTSVASSKARSGGASGSGKATEHTIKNGETLWSISRRYGLSVNELQKANKLAGSTIVPGRTLKIPGGAAAAAPAETVRAAADVSVQAAKKDAVSLVEHEVKTGETLWSIARVYSSSVSAIQGANRIGDGMIVPGQKLLIPR